MQCLGYEAVFSLFVLFPPWIKIFLTPFKFFWSVSFLFFLDETACNTVTFGVNMPKDGSLYSGWGKVTEMAESSGMYFGVILFNINSVILCKELHFFGTRMAGIVRIVKFS